MFAKLALYFMGKGKYKLSLLCLKVHCKLWPYLYHKKWKRNAKENIDKWEWL